MLTLALLLSLAQPRPAATARLVFGGDVIPHGPIKQVARAHERKDEAGASLNAGGWDQVFGPLASVFKRDDLAVVNLESPVVAGAEATTKEFVFNAPPALLAGLRRAGVAVATFANNHALDQGREGIVATRQALAEAGLATAGAGASAAEAWQPLVVERHGVTFGLLAVTRWLNGLQNSSRESKPQVPCLPYAKNPLVAGRTPQQVADAVRALASKVDVVVVSVHWGEEYSATPLAEDRALARTLLEAGAAAVIGHHPHVLQPVEWVDLDDGRRGLVAWSLGNLVSNQDFDNEAGTKRDGLLLELTFRRAEAGGAVVLEAAVGVPVATENRLGRGARRMVQPVLLDDELAAIDERLAQLAERGEPEARRERALLTHKRRISLERLERIHAVLGPSAVLAGLPP